MWNCFPPNLSGEELVLKWRHNQMRRCWYKNYILRRRFTNCTSVKTPPYFSEDRLPPYKEPTKKLFLHTLARNGNCILHLPTPRLEEFSNSSDDPTGIIAAFGHGFMWNWGSIGTSSNVSKIELERLVKLVVHLQNWERKRHRSKTGGIMHRLWVNIMAHGYEAA